MENGGSLDAEEKMEETMRDTYRGILRLQDILRSNASPGKKEDAKEKAKDDPIVKIDVKKRYYDWM